jgi:hypothetical protein
MSAHSNYCEEDMADILLRFGDLKNRKIVNNHVKLARWILREGFPSGFMLGPNTRVWRESEVDAWLASRPIANKQLRGAAKRNAEAAAPNEAA